MKKISLTFLFIGAIAAHGFSQRNTFTTAKNNKLNKDTTESPNAPAFLFKIEGKGLVNDRFIGNVSVNSITKVEVVKNDEVLKQYGPHGKNGVAIVTLSPTTDYVATDKMFDKYALSKKERSLPLFIDSVVAVEPSKMIFDLKNIKSVKIAIEKETGMRYISLITSSPQMKPKRGDMYIRGTTASL